MTADEPMSTPDSGGCLVILERPEMWENKARPQGAGNTSRPLTHSLDLTKEGMAVKATRFQFGDDRLPARFWAKVELGDLGCWQWTGSLTRGYGAIRIDGKGWRPHRLAYVCLVGPIDRALVIDHLCRNRCCVNPLHLEVVTNRENTLRGISPSAIHARQTHCHRGHEFTPENTHYRPSRPNMRICRACKRIHRKTAKDKARAARKAVAA